MIRIVLPAALPEILTGCRTGLVLALITMVTSEMIARQSGAGNILFNALDMGQYDTVFAMIIIIGAMGIGLDAAFEKLRARLVRWSEPRFDHSVELLMNARAVTTDILLGMVPIALLVGLWQAIDLVRLCASDVAAAARRRCSCVWRSNSATATFQQEIGATLFRLFAGFSIAVMLGVGIGLAAAVSPAVNAVVRPLVRVLAPLPKVALYPALLLLLGFGHESKITLVAADALFPILLSTYYGASMVEQKLIWSAMAAGTPRASNPVQGGAAGGGAVDPHRLPHRSRDLLHRGVSGRNDHLDRWPRPSPGDGGADLSGRRHVRSADHDFAAGLDSQRAAAALRSYLLRGFPEV